VDFSPDSSEFFHVGSTAFAGDNYETDLKRAQGQMSQWGCGKLARM
jgi:hypothetical protein